MRVPLGNCAEVQVFTPRHKTGPAIAYANQTVQVNASATTACVL
jgi:hypothetical protein